VNVLKASLHDINESLHLIIVMVLLWSFAFAKAGTSKAMKMKKEGY
jgi:hypothetical protein